MNENLTVQKLLVVIFLITMTNNVFCLEKTVPTPECTPLEYHPIILKSDDIDETYEGGETITVNVLPVTEGDWITTPTSVQWTSTLTSSFYGGESEEFYIPNPPPTQLTISVYTVTRINEECPPYDNAIVRQASITYTCSGINCPSTPTPGTPTPSPTSTWTITPICTGVPLEACAQRVIINPPKNEDNLYQNEFTFSFIEPAEWAYSFRDFFTLKEHPVTILGDNLFHVADLEYGGCYELTYICEYLECDNDRPRIVWRWMCIVDSPTPSPTDTPTSPSLTTGWMTTQLLDLPNPKTNPYQAITPLPTPPIR